MLLDILEEMILEKRQGKKTVTYGRQLDRK